MNRIQKIILCVAVVTLLGATAALRAEEKTTEVPKPYPLATCVVSGEKLGEMGKPVVTNSNGQEIKFCCKNCLKDFNKNPAKYLKMIDEAEKSKK